MEKRKEPERTTFGLKKDEVCGQFQLNQSQKVFLSKLSGAQAGVTIAEAQGTTGHWAFVHNLPGSKAAGRY